MRNIQKANARTQNGFTLVELMVALVLGLLVVGAASALFLSSRRTYGATASVNRMQENGRAAFEIMARDLRAAGGNPCSSNVVNMLVNRGTTAWTNWSTGLIGTDGSPDSVTVYYADDSASTPITQQADPQAPIQVGSTSGINANDVLMACNAQQSVIFAVTNVSAATGIKHDVGALNAMTAFQQDPAKVINASTATTGYCFTTPAGGINANPNCLDAGDGPGVIVKPISVNWAVGNNANNGKSLFRTVSANGVQISRDEIASGITNMQLTYQKSDSSDFLDAGTVAGDWGNVIAVKIELTLQPEAGAVTAGDRNGTGGQLLTRTLSSTVSLRNRKDVRE